MRRTTKLAAALFAGASFLGAQAWARQAPAQAVSISLKVKKRLGMRASVAPGSQSVRLGTAASFLLKDGADTGIFYGTSWSDEVQVLVSPSQGAAGLYTLQVNAEGCSLGGGTQEFALKDGKARLEFQIQCEVETTRGTLLGKLQTIEAEVEASGGGQG